MSDSIEDRVVAGLLSSPKYIPRDVEWCSQLGQVGFAQRVADLGPNYVSNLDIPRLTETMPDISASLSNEVIYVAFLSGMSPKYISVLRSLLDGRDGRKVLFIPLDVNPDILLWKQKVVEEFGSEAKRVIVKPVCEDITTAFDTLSSIVDSNEYRSWSVLFTQLGFQLAYLPYAIIRPTLQFVAQTFRNRGGDGFMLSSYKQLIEDGPEKFTRQHMLNLVNEWEYTMVSLRCVNAVCDADFDLEAYEPYFDFTSRHKMPDGVVVGGYDPYVTSKCEQDVYLGNRKLTIHVDKGERIRLDDKQPYSRFYPDAEMEKLMNECGLKISNKRSGGGFELIVTTLKEA